MGLQKKKRLVGAESTPRTNYKGTETGKKSCHGGGYLIVYLVRDKSVKGTNANTSGQKKGRKSVLRVKKNGALQRQKGRVVVIFNQTRREIQ